MTERPTPGQICDATYHCACGCWRDLDAEAQARWEAAAQAVRTDRPLLRYALGVHVQWASAPDVWTIEARRWTERTLLPPIAEYGLRRPGDRLGTWAYEADLTVVEEEPHAP